MFDYKDNGDFTEVWGWDEFNGDDDKLIGAIRKCEEGYSWFHPARKVVLSCKMLIEIAKKLSELNT